MTNCFPHDEIAAQHQLSGQKLGISSNTSRNIPDWRKRRCPVLREGNLFLKTRPREPAIGQMHATGVPRAPLLKDKRGQSLQTNQHLSGFFNTPLCNCGRFPEIAEKITLPVQGLRRE